MPGPATPVARVTTAELRQAVATRYGQVAVRPTAGFGFPVGRAYAEAVGYPPVSLDTLPPAASAAFTGVTCLPAWTALQPGEVVVDLGSGAGLDALLAARTVGPGGRVLAVDLSPEMARLARVNARDAGFATVDVVSASVEALPLAAGLADVVTANGVFNLAPDKERAIAEAVRVLKRGGRLVAAELVLSRDVPAAERNTLDDWFR
jgi:SAM-dependent methyltransferase